MADDLTVKSPGAGARAVARGEANEVGADPEELKFQEFVEASRKRGVNVPESNLRRIFAFGEARAAQEAQKAESSRAHYAQNETESVDEKGVSRQEEAAELTGAAQVRSVATGLTPEDERQVSGGKLGTTPLLPPPDSAPITSEGAVEFLGNVFRNHLVNGETLDLESALAEVTSSKSASAPRPKGGVRAGSGQAGLSMKVGAGGANLASAPSASSASSSSPRSSSYTSSAGGIVGYNWPNLEAALVQFMMRDEQDYLKTRKMLKALRRDEAKSSQQGRKLDIAVTEMQQFFSRARAAQGLMSTSEEVSQGIVQAAADGVTGKLEDADPLESTTQSSKHLEKLRATMSNIADEVAGPGEHRATTGNLNDSPRTLLTKRELEDLRTNKPEVAKKYDDAFEQFSDIHSSTALACLKHNRALLPEEQRTDFDEQIEAVEKRVTSRSRLAFKDPRGFGMLSYNRSTHYQMAHKATEKIDGATAELEGLKAKLEKNPGDAENLNGKIQEKEKEIMKARVAKLELLGAVVEVDNRLAAPRPLDDAHIASQEQHVKGVPDQDEKANVAIGHWNEKIGKKKKSIADLKKKVEALDKNTNEKKVSQKEEKIKKAEVKIRLYEKKIKNIEKDIKERSDVLEYEGVLFESMANRRFPQDLDKVTPDDESDVEGGVVVTEGLEPPKELSNDLEKRLHELEIRAKAGEQFLSEKSGTFDLRAEKEFDQITRRITQQLEKLAGTARGPANRFIHGSIGSAMQNAKLAGAMIQRTQAMTDRLLDTAARMRR